MSTFRSVKLVLRAAVALLAVSSALFANPPSVTASVSSDVVANLLLVKRGLGDSLGELADWVSTDLSPCNWTGVACRQISASDNDSSIVIGLDLSSRNLTGSIPEEIGALTDLQVLDLNNNALNGEIPSALTSLTQLTFINLTSNYLNGSFPAGMSALQNLRQLDAYDNFFSGPLPEEIGQLSELVYLHLGGNYFEGEVPAGYWNLRKLEFLNLAGNELVGPVPPAIGNLTSLTWLEMGYNSFNCELPPEIGNLRELTYIDVSWAQIVGQIPRELGQLSKLNSIFLFRNQLAGTIPVELGNLSSIWSLDLSNNSLSGSIPLEFGNLKQLRLLSLWGNKLVGTVPTSIGDLPHLLTLFLWKNSFSGSLPQQLGLSSSLSNLDVSSNNFTGPIPPDLCKSGALWKLMLFDNSFTGPVPVGLATCQSLIRVRMENNLLMGPIPAGFGSVPSLDFLDLSGNQLNGSIPEDIVSAAEMTFLDVSYNHLTGVLPSSEAIWTFYNLQEFHAAGNALTGSIPPEFGKLPSMGVLDLADNALTGHIPPALGNCSKMTSLDLSNNKLSGNIPPELGNIMVLSWVDLSRNQLDGRIPTTLTDLTNLEAFNVSFNNLHGPIPYSGNLQIMNTSWFIGNPDLCGRQISRPCTAADEQQHKGKKGGAVAFMIAGVFLVALGVLILGICCFYRQYHWQIRRVLKGGISTPAEWPWILTTFQRLNFTADEVVGCMKESNIIGMGGAGTVYKGEFPGGDIVAVKRLWGSCKPEVHMGRDQGFSAEVDLLGSIRHRNIVRLLGFCTNHEMNLLIYEYMPNGSLGELLHGWKNGTNQDGKKVNILADWLTRFNIALGVAQGLAYLHHDCCPPIVHRDVKSNNILLDSNMEARVADFGLAKLFESNQSMSLVAGSYGYIAPEYAYTLKVDEKSDIYSLGVVLLELLTGRQPVESTELGESVNIVDWVTKMMQSKDGMAEVLDSDVGSGCNSVQEEMIMVLRIALLCTSRLPKDRPSMRDVVTMLSEAQPRRKNPSQESSFRSRAV
ncbi:hypothetical protein R1sor_018808 [Riccia sorocarpa]|uniref:non-specific serine/threonine protein kinase n=1 Tax=Riccia sorocarpa TaxID=122646 RepID=A0ABD3IBU4_9MARC